MRDIIWKKLPSVSSGMFYQTLFDPHQTHGLYGVQVDDVPYWKEYLKKHGAKKFRVVKNCYGKAIICFAWQVDNEAMEKIRLEKIKAEEEMNYAKEIVRNSEFGKFIENANESQFNFIARKIQQKKISAKLLNIHHMDEIMSAEKFADKNYQRIYDIILKSSKGNTFVVNDLNFIKATELACQMAKKIKSPEKMLARKNAALDLGFLFLADCFN
jgi:cellobiose-specific phosphotransferase system component IIA